ncbi:hypothetical protein [Ignatzschineria indica]|nr:hypothetical protein [Ignatzschineria indica]
MSCRTSLSHTSKNDMPAMDIDNANLHLWACSSEKSEIIGSRNSTTPLIA